MKNNKLKNSLRLLLCVILIACSNGRLYAQAKKQQARISVSFIKEGNSKHLKISGKYKDGKEFKLAEGLDLEVYQVFENDSLVLLDTAILNKKGIAEVDVNKVFQNELDQYTFEIIHENSEKFKKASSDLSIQIANLETNLETNGDDGHTIVAKLTNAKNEPIEGSALKVQLQRLFAPLSVGEGIYITDENGTINVPITQKMPGLDGKLNYEVILADSEDYGTIKSVIETNIGKPIVDLSTFDERTMWSPPAKAPWADLIIPNLLILGIWGTLVILVINLFKISKHKNS
ncbi:hypothetical protein [Mariniflexile sp.]|uniref:hypothetical protein n=1 Tax=Mariniflexile sp. TaxID=1979402 RepID=UPI004047B6E8